ncbi:MAG: aldo/keto reductase [Vicinamibacterales bacterium]
MRAIGLSEVGPETIRRAHAMHPIADVQIEYSLISRAPEAHLFPLADRRDCPAANHRASPPEAR